MDDDKTPHEKQEYMRSLEDPERYKLFKIMRDSNQGYLNFKSEDMKGEALYLEPRNGNQMLHLTKMLQQFEVPFTKAEKRNFEVYHASGIPGKPRAKKIKYANALRISKEDFLAVVQRVGIPEDAPPAAEWVRRKIAFFKDPSSILSKDEQTLPPPATLNM